jgi:tetratricopeptide (TPR) repeat protein
MSSRIIALVLAFACASFGLAGGVDLIGKADAEAKAGNHDAALRIYTEAIKATDLTKAQLAHAYYKRGGVHGYLGENVKGIADYSDSLKHNPNFGYALSLRGYLRAAIGQYDLAEADQKAALALTGSTNSPTYQPWVLQHYADIWRRRGQYEKALELCAQALQLNEYPSAYFRRAWIYLDMGRLADAKTAFQKFEAEMVRQGTPYSSFWLDERGAIERLRKL